MKKNTLIISIVITILLILSIIAINDFDNRYALQPNIIRITATYKKVNKTNYMYYIYEYDDKEFIIREDNYNKYLSNQNDNIEITLTKTNNLFIYIQTYFNKNASIVWKNGILYLISNIKGD